MDQSKSELHDSLSNQLSSVIFILQLQCGKFKKAISVFIQTLRDAQDGTSYNGKETPPYKKALTSKDAAFPFNMYTAIKCLNIEWDL